MFPDRGGVFPESPAGISRKVYRDQATLFRQWRIAAPGDEVVSVDKRLRLRLRIVDLQIVHQTEPNVLCAYRKVSMFIISALLLRVEADDMMLLNPY